MARMAQRARCSSSCAYCFSSGVRTLAISATWPVNIVDVPVTRGWRGGVLHGRLDDGREIRLKGFPQRRPEFSGRLQRDAASAERARHRRIIHGISFTVPLEETAEAPAVMHLLQ